MSNRATERQYLVEQAYATGANLAARQAIYRFQRPQLRMVEWALEQIDWRDAHVAVDVGCGNGAYLRHLSGRVPRLIGVDLSRGMLAEARAACEPGTEWPTLCVADAQALPLRDASADMVLAMHMLYHVPDVAAAANEMRRVLRPGGVLLASTNGEGHVHELFELLAMVVASVGGPRPPSMISFAHFSAETGGAQLTRAFGEVEWRPAVSTLVVPEVEPVLAYLNSLRAFVEPSLPAASTWDACMAEAARLVRQHLAADGGFRVSTVAGVFVCR